MAPAPLDLLLDAVPELLGAFAGVFLALLAEDRREQRREARRREAAQEGFRGARHAILGSVVRNTLELKRVRGLLEDGEDPLLLGVALERAVWEATRSTYVDLAPTVDERVTVARFFDGVERIETEIAFHRGGVRRDGDPTSAKDGGLREASRTHLAQAADRLALQGRVLVSEYGEEVHREMMGIPNVEQAG